MPLFFLIAIGAGVITIGSVATDAKRFTGKQTAEAMVFDASAYTSAADCLTAAAAAGAPATTCANRR